MNICCESLVVGYLPCHSWVLLYIWRRRVKGVPVNNLPCRNAYKNTTTMFKIIKTIMINNIMNGIYLYAVLILYVVCIITKWYIVQTYSKPIKLQCKIYGQSPVNPKRWSTLVNMKHLCDFFERTNIILRRRQTKDMRANLTLSGQWWNAPFFRPHNHITQFIGEIKNTMWRSQSGNLKELERRTKSDTPERNLL